ncbi:MAG: hypothetical protein NVSMB55_22800 [Mycobacteriales bacterium]
MSAAARSADQQRQGEKAASQCAERRQRQAGRRRVGALQIVSEGMTYHQVADDMGHSNMGTVHHIV